MTELHLEDWNEKLSICIKVVIAFLIINII